MNNYESILKDNEKTSPIVSLCFTKSSKDTEIDLSYTTVNIDYDVFKLPAELLKLIRAAYDREAYITLKIRLKNETF